MKKAYTKPLLSKESFNLTESVASNCGWLGGVTYGGSKEGGFNNGNECTWKLGDDTFFNSSAIGCVITELDPGTYCYNGLTDGIPVFRS